MTRVVPIMPHYRIEKVRRDTSSSFCDYATTMANAGNVLNRIGSAPLSGTEGEF